MVPQGARGDPWLCCAVPVAPGHHSDTRQGRAVWAGTGDVFLQCKRVHFMCLVSSVTQQSNSGEVAVLRSASADASGALLISGLHL